MIKWASSLNLTLPMAMKLASADLTIYQIGSQKYKKWQILKLIHYGYNALKCVRMLCRVTWILCIPVWLFGPAFDKLHETAGKIMPFIIQYCRSVNVLVWWCNTMVPEQNGWQFVDNKSTCIFVNWIKFMGPTLGPCGADRTQVGPMLAPWTLLSGNETIGISIKISMKFIPWRQIVFKPSLVQMMTLYQTDNKPLLEPMMPLNTKPNSLQMTISKCIFVIWKCLNFDQNLTDFYPEAKWQDISGSR